MGMRSRSQYQIVATPAIAEAFHTSCSDLSWWEVAELYPSLSGKKRVMIDNVVEHFHKRRRAGEKFFNDMLSEEVFVHSAGSGYYLSTVLNSCDISPGPFKAQHRCTGDAIMQFLPLQGSADGGGNYLPIIQTALDQDDIDRVMRLVSTEVEAKRGTLDTELWESVAQYRQTLALLMPKLQHIADKAQIVLRAAERSRTSRALLKEVSDGYLLFRYGISPTMKDVKQILEAFKRDLGTREITSRASERMSAMRVLSGTKDFGPFRATWSCSVNDTATIRGFSLDRGFVSFANAAGLNFKGLLLLPLQLTSYSFVADWFTNLSSYVSSTIPALGWTKLGAQLVTQRSSNSAYALTGVTNLEPTLYNISQYPSGTATVDRLSKTRSVLLPSSLEIKSDFKFDKMTRVADAVALIASRFVRISALTGFRPNNSAFHDRKAYHAWESHLRNF